MDLDHLEALAFGEDRARALESLIPGTEDYYFYTALDHLHGGRLVPVRDLLKTWIQRHGRTTRATEIERRLALLGVTTDPKASFEHIREHLGLYFSHARVVEDEVTNFPSALDQTTISRETLDAEAFSQYSDLTGFEDSALDRVVAAPLNEYQRRSLLDRLRRPDYPQLVQLVLEDLEDKHTGSFGSRPIHGLLLLQQLDQLAEKRPQLLTETKFVDVYLSRLHPSRDLDWENNPVEYQIYLERLWSFADKLSPSFNALKTHILYHRLVFDRSRGIYDLARFTSYLKLPRRAAYMRTEYLDRKDLRDHQFSLGTSFKNQTKLPDFNDDTEVVRDYLAHFYLPANDYELFKEWIQDGFAKNVFAVTKILAGSGDAERWYSVLENPSYYQQLKERVDIQLAPTNREYFRANDPVSLTVDIKNVPSLVVKLFKINALAYYRLNHHDVNTGVDLDGLVAAEEQTHQYSEPPLRRIRSTFTFESLRQPGVYVVEMIGNGRSSRALIRKGRLRYLERLSAAGHIFTILDEDNQILPDATLWLGSREYRAREGEIVVPYSTQPRKTDVLLVHGDVITVETFHHRGESYEFPTQLHVERESLLSGKKAELFVRPVLTLNGVPVSLKLLENIRLEISSTDERGVSASRTISPVQLESAAETIIPFQTPENIRSMTIELHAQVRRVVDHQQTDLTASWRTTLNQIDASSRVQAFYLSRTAGGWVLYYLGKTGEARAHKALSLTLKHRDYTREIYQQLQTDEDGRIELGALDGIVRVQVSDSEHQRTFELSGDAAIRPPAIHARAGEELRLPWIANSTSPLRSELSLLESRGTGYLRDAFDTLAISHGTLRIRGLSAGDYNLRLKDEPAEIILRISAGELRASWIASEKQLLETALRPPLTIESIDAGPEQLHLRIGGHTPATRVHVFATRFYSERNAFEELGESSGMDLQRVELEKAKSHYLSGRDIGEEYRYILERKYSPKYPGNNLARPGLLLNPWSIRTTASQQRTAADGAAYAAAAPPRAPMRSQTLGQARGGSGGNEPEENLDFLTSPARIFGNLRPDPSGMLAVSLSSLAGATEVRVVVIDAPTVPAVSRVYALPEPDADHRDLRLRLALEAQEHFLEKKQATALAPGEKLIIEDITTSKIERFDHLAQIHRLFTALSPDANLRKFDFILEWPRLSDAEKRSKYSEHACHELSFFLSRKDPAFFAEVIKPYLRNKRELTFMDNYLLENNLERYFEPWAHGRLNILEKILLAQRVPRDQDATARHARDRLDLLPPDVEGEARLFDSAVQGSALDEGGGGGGFGAAKEAALSAKLMAAPSMDMMPAEPPASVGGMEKKKSRKMAGPAKAAPRAASAPRDGVLNYDEVMGEVSDEEAIEDYSDLEKETSRAADRDDGARDLRLREEARPHFRQVDKTEEWAENNYYKLRANAQGEDLITINAFWRDYAAHDPKKAFTSRHFPKAHRNFTEMMCALAVLDLPFAAKAVKEDFAGARMEMEAAENSIVFHQEIKPVKISETKSPVLVSQNYFRADDRYSYEENETVDKYVTGEMLVHVPYLCQVVLTNPSSSAQKLDLLLQIPRGALPLENGFFTRGQHVHLSPHETTTIEYHFYFPAPGVFPHFPVQVSKNEELVGFAPPTSLNVVSKLSQVDMTSWAWISQNAEPQAVLSYLDKNNIERLDLEQIAWRMGNKSYFEKTLALLTARHVFHSTLWSYAIKHRDHARSGEYLRHQDSFLREAGWSLTSPLVDADPVVRHWYEHLEYSPLVNARAHKLGAKTVILDSSFSVQYQRFLEVLTYVPSLGLKELLAATYYLLLQDRVGEAIAMLRRADGAGAGDENTRLQRDYLRAYVAFYQGDLMSARTAVEPHRDHPVDRWRKLFQTVLAQIAEASGKAAAVVDEKQRDQRHDQLASTEPALELAVEQKTVRLSYQNIQRVTVSYYRMDIELLFSRQPFVQQQSDRFSIIKPNAAQTIELPQDRREFSFELPAEYHSANIVIEVNGGGIHKAQANYANDLNIGVIEQYGQVRISRRATQELLPKVYVKVYARKSGGEIKFYKDGYTDLRGIFDYASLSTNELDSVERFSILVMSEGHGSVIREAAPPKR